VSRPVGRRGPGPKGRETRDRLLAAGAELLGRGGRPAPTVAAVAAAAGTSPTSFYRYFADLDDLLVTLTTDAADDLAAVRPGPITPDDEGRAELRAWLGRLAEHYRARAGAIRAWVEAETPDGDLGRQATDLLGGWADELARQVEAHAAPAVNPRIAAVAVVAMIERSLYLEVVAHPGLGPEAESPMLDTLASVAHRALVRRT